MSFMGDFQVVRSVATLGCMTRRTAFRVGVVIFIALLTLGNSLLYTGKFGLVIAADCLAGLGMIVALAAVPRGAREPEARRPHRAWAWPSWAIST